MVAVVQAVASVAVDRAAVALERAARAMVDAAVLAVMAAAAGVVDGAVTAAIVAATVAVMDGAGGTEVGVGRSHVVAWGSSMRLGRSITRPSSV